MIISMTGYGDATLDNNGVSHFVEVRSLNNRYFKCNIRLPDHLQFLETEVERLLRTRMGRGSINFFLRLQQNSAEGAYKINTAIVEAYLGALRGIVKDDSHVTMDLATVLTLPGVCQPPEMDEETRERQWSVLETLANQAIDRLIEMRKAEGRVLRDDLVQHCRKIGEQLQIIVERAPTVIEEYRRRLQTRVNNLLADAKLELQEEMLVREVAVYADRCDISEELSRMGSHLDQFVNLCDSKESAGRRLDFLTQEMLREGNTIGSKANDSQISRCVVEIKSLVDRLREQVQNVE